MSLLRKYLMYILPVHDNDNNIQLQVNLKTTLFR